MPTLLTNIVAWLREGYPSGVPDHDYIALFALLRRRLTDDEVVAVARELADADMISLDREDIGASILKVTDSEPSDADIDRVREHLAFRGFPVRELD